MMLRELIGGTAAIVHGRASDAVDVAKIAIHSHEVKPESLFIAINGVALDGHDFLPEAAARGAAALVVEDEARIPADFTGAVVVVPDARAALNHLASRFYGDPGRELFCVGVTGTDGKSTVGWMAEAVLNGCGMPTGVIGTVDHHFGGHTWPGDTTPPPLALQERLYQFRELGARAVTLEATSQGLSQSRVGSVPLDVAVFTNLARDHLDYHRTLEAYFQAKERLFTETLAATHKAPCHAIINIDTPYGARIRVPAKATRMTYGRHGVGADLEYEVVGTELSGTVFRLTRSAEQADLHLPMLGAFNGANALAAVAVGMAAGYDFRACVEALSVFAGVPGRMQRVATSVASASVAKMVFIDYAHDPQAFDGLLPTVRAVLRRERPDGRLVTVFGCGGDRDRGKRPLMLQSALRSSDRVIITSDNPRNEDPRAILDDILTGVNSPADEERILVELDRSKALRMALESTTECDVILILGKGHEPYQIVGRRRLPYCDSAVVEAHLAALTLS